MKYTITSFCHGSIYNSVRPHWEDRTRKLHPESKIVILSNYLFKRLEGYGWWDIVRLEKIIDILSRTRLPTINCDLDLILERNISPLIELDYDFIVSKEIGGNNAFPHEISSKMGFGLCTGVYIAKYSSIAF